MLKTDDHILKVSRVKTNPYNPSYCCACAIIVSATRSYCKARSQVPKMPRPDSPAVLYNALPRVTNAHYYILPSRMKHNVPSSAILGPKWERGNTIYIYFTAVLSRPIGSEPTWCFTPSYIVYFWILADK